MRNIEKTNVNSFFFFFVKCPEFLLHALGVMTLPVFYSNRISAVTSVLLISDTAQYENTTVGLYPFTRNAL